MPVSILGARRKMKNSEKRGNAGNARKMKDSEKRWTSEKSEKRTICLYLMP